MLSVSSVLRHAIGMIFRDLPATLRVLAPSLVIVGGLVIGALALLPNEIRRWLTDDGDVSNISPQLAGNAVVLVLLLAFGSVIAFSLMAVLWHRYVLADDDMRAGGLMPAPGVVGGYIGRSILLGLILMLLMLPILFVVGIAGAATGGNLIAIGLVGIAAAAVLAWVSLRLSLVLPATALERPIGFGASWRESGRASGTIFWLAVVLALLNQGLEWLTQPFSSLPLPLLVLLQVVLTVITTLISVSVLTTLYGVLIEKRDIG